MIFTATGILLNGATPLVAIPVPYQQKLSVPSGCDGRLNLTVIDPSGAAVNITAGTLVLTIKNRFTDSGSPQVSRAGTVISGPAGTCYFAIVEADTVSPSTLSVGPCQYDIWWTDGTGTRHQLVPLSDFEILPAVAVPGSPTTAPAGPTIINYPLPSPILANDFLRANSAGDGVLWAAAVTVPDPGASDVGKAIVVTGYSPQTLGFASIGGGSGTVTSVAMTAPSILSVAGSPVTSAGTLALTLATQSANTVFAGPTSGSAAAPTMRALVAADIPSVLWYSPARIAAARATAPTAGNLAHGRGYAFDTTVTVAGVKFYWGGGKGALTIRCRLWNPSSSSVASVDVSVNAAGQYTGTFASAFTVLSTQVGNTFMVSAWETSATWYQQTAGVTIVETGSSVPIGNHIISVTTTNMYGAGDVIPSTSATGGSTNYFGVEPVLQ